MMVPNPGFNKGIKKRPDFVRMAWAWKGAQSQSVERKLNPMQAINEGRELYKTLTAKLGEVGVERRDLTVFAVFADKKNLGKKVGMVQFVSSHSEDSHDLEAAVKHQRDAAVGFVIGVYNRKDKHVIAHFRPLILQHESLKLLESLVAEVVDTKSKCWKVS
jgi:hypothetical protein